jgi:hypothetical protein
MATDNMTKSITPIGGALKDYEQTFRDSYKASRTAGKSRTDALKDARAAAKTVWTADKTTMKTSGYVRKKTSSTAPGGQTLSTPPSANQPGVQTRTGGFRLY